MQIKRFSRIVNRFNFYGVIFFVIFFYLFLESFVDGKVRNYDIRMGKLRVDCIGQLVISVSFIRDGQCVLILILDDIIRFLDKDIGELLNE